MSDLHRLAERVGFARGRTLGHEQSSAPSEPAANFATNLTPSMISLSASDHSVAQTLQRCLRDEILTNVRSLMAGDDSAVINLALADAPSLQITVQLAGAAVSIVVTGAGAETRGLLHAMLPSLRKSLAAQGLCLSSLVSGQGEEAARGERSVCKRELDTYA